MTKRPKAKTTLATFSVLGSVLGQSTPQLAAAAAMKQLRPPRAPKPKSARKSTLPLPAASANAVVVPITAVAPSTVPALPVSAEDDRIAARVAALVVARETFPDVFDNCCPPLPSDMFRRLCGAGIAAEASADVIRWWISMPDYRRTKAKRIDGRIGARMASLPGLRELAPMVFDLDEPLPLAIDAHDQLTELGLSAEEVRSLLRWWTRRREYHAALARGGSRYNLDASVAGSISDEDQEHARRKAADLAPRQEKDQLAVSDDHELTHGGDCQDGRPTNSTSSDKRDRRGRLSIRTLRYAKRRQENNGRRDHG